MNTRTDLLIRALQRGARSAGELADALGVSQPTLSRTLALLPSSRLHRMGRARASRYAWRREVEGATQWPLYRLDGAGEAHRSATLTALEGGAWHVEWEEAWPSLEHPMFQNGLFPDWPWFLDDLNPRGFLGRLFARACAERVGLPPDPRDWSAAHTLRGLVVLGKDLPGAWVIGEQMLAQAQDPETDAEGLDADPGLLLERARGVLEGRWPGSSAAGEQPKFTLTLGSGAGVRRHFLVKFSGEAELPDQARHADLLRAEHLANRILSENDIPAAHTELRVVEGRTFLIAERFDRTQNGGRRPVISLYALNAAFGDVNRGWADSAADLRRQGWLDDSGAERLGIAWAFGRLIGNTDMHDGNASFFLHPRIPLTHTPMYDMCPMALAPRADGTLPDLLPPLPPPPPEHETLFARARPLAKAFFEAVKADPEFTPAFRLVFKTRLKRDFRHG